MPTPGTTKWPRPKSEDEWEDMVLDAMRIHWNDPNANRNGRRGQGQNGVDIFGLMNGKAVGAQAKNMERISGPVAVKEIAKAEKFYPTLKQYFFAVAGSRDEKFQLFLRTLSEQRMINNLFSVNVLFFEDVVHELSSNVKLVEKYWGNFFVNLAKAISVATTHPILDDESAIATIKNLEEYKRMSEYFDATSNPNVNLFLAVENAPNLRAPFDSMDRFWRIAIGELHPDRIVSLNRIAISVDSKDVRIWQAVDNSWSAIEK